MSKLPLAPSVVASKAIKHYGTCCSSQWDSIRDRGFPKYNDEWMGPNRCDIMKWFIYMVILSLVTIIFQIVRSPTKGSE